MNAQSDQYLQLPEPPSAARRIAMGAKHHFSGTLVFGEGAGRTMQVESHTEMQVALVMLARPEVIDLENQLPHRWTDRDGALRTHFFDFRVSLRNGSRIALIVRSARKAANLDFRQTVRLIASQVLPEFADQVGVMTEKHLDPIEVHNAELIQSVRQSDPEADAEVRSVISGMVGAGRIGDLAERTGLRGRGFRAVVRLIRRQELVLATHERITHDALVRKRAA
ncbi:hypothetical protein GI374_07480 [Paracoccus sp. S-4012]|uniref:hypothetical protein n=1 Tax=Paracoccus sp. S-4012 TaxID=2665648 RepID=UPI0012AF698D|nr:hypothetical protein [Paracoccus sp. S-4012]MRX50290.1 hypothetical protein [Paracoccus sp. S-4012]